MIIWTEHSAHAYIDPILQALFSIPQVRIALSSLADHKFDHEQTNEKGLNLLLDTPAKLSRLPLGHRFHKLVEMATFLDKARISVLLDDMIAPGLAEMLNTTETDFRKLSPRKFVAFISTVVT